MKPWQIGTIIAAAVLFGLALVWAGSLPSAPGFVVGPFAGLPPECQQHVVLMSETRWCERQCVYAYVGPFGTCRQEWEALAR